MSTSNNLKSLIYFILVFISIFYDVLLGSSKYPIVTLIVCAILIIYERVSPFVYFTR